MLGRVDVTFAGHVVLHSLISQSRGSNTMTRSRWLADVQNEHRNEEWRVFQWLWRWWTWFLMLHTHAVGGVGRLYWPAVNPVSQYVISLPLPCWFKVTWKHTHTHTHASGLLKLVQQAYRCKGEHWKKIKPSWPSGTSPLAPHTQTCILFSAGCWWWTGWRGFSALDETWGRNIKSPCLLRSHESKHSLGRARLQDISYVSPWTPCGTSCWLCPRRDSSEASCSPPLPQHTDLHAQKHKKMQKWFWGRKATHFINLYNWYLI